MKKGTSKIDSKKFPYDNRGFVITEKLLQILGKRGEISIEKYLTREESNLKLKQNNFL
jgi:hypothetical protein